jgi:hypothetical protein
MSRAVPSKVLVRVLPIVLGNVVALLLFALFSPNMSRGRVSKTFFNFYFAHFILFAFYLIKV